MLTKLAVLRGERWAAEAEITTGRKRDGEIRKRYEGERRKEEGRQRVLILSDRCSNHPV